MRTPIGPLLAILDAQGLRSLSFIESEDSLEPYLRKELARIGSEASEAGDGNLAPVFQTVRDYLENGRITLPDDLRLAPGGTPFQNAVWEALRAIPEGETRTYAALCRTLGYSIGSARAVGAACGANPIAMLIPCHRVVPATGKPGNFRWGLSRKKWLLDRERAAGHLPGIRGAESVEIS